MLHRLDGAHGRSVGVLVELATRAPLTQQIPALIECDLDALDPCALLGAQRRLTMPGAQRVLFLHQGVDLREDLFVIHVCAPAAAVAVHDSVAVVISRTRPVPSALVLGVVAAVLSAACVSGAARDTAGSVETEAPVAVADERLAIQRVATGLDGPTQMIAGPDGRLWVAQLAGGENAGRGQVVAVDVASGAQDVLVDDLDKPTGLAWLDTSLWIATPTALLRADGQPPGRPEPAVTGLPNNGRSNGTLTLTPGGALLYETSGRERDGAAVDGSGALWVLDPRRPDTRAQVASGLKNAYAHVYDDRGQLWATEVAEPIGGVAAPDELNQIVLGGDYGWPACVGRQVPVEAFGGDDGRCARTRAPLLTFDEIGATPTSIVVSPFDDGHFVVALWNVGRVVTVATDGDAPPEDLVTGLTRPQHLLVDGDTLLVSDHERGSIWRVRRR